MIILQCQTFSLLRAGRFGITAYKLRETLVEESRDLTLIPDMRQRALSKCPGSRKPNVADTTFPLDNDPPAGRSHDP